MQGVNDMRSPDARDAAGGRQIVGTGPPTWPVTPQPIARPRAIASTPSSALTEVRPGSVPPPSLGHSRSQLQASSDCAAAASPDPDR
jgi:hypothetical protein